MTAVEPEQIEGYELSPQQQAVYLRQGADHRAEHGVRCASTIAPSLLAGRMEALVAQYEILRTRYVTLPGLRMPVQVVDAAGPVDVAPGPFGSTLLRAGELTVEHTDSPDGSLLRLGLPRLSVDRTTWSVITGLLLGESPQDADAQAGEERLQYTDVTGWLADEIDPSGTAEETEETAGTRTALPFLAPARLWNPDAEPETLSLTVEGPALRRLRTAARDLDVDEAALLLAAWCSLYARYTHHSDDRVVVVTDGRSADGLSGMPGLLERPVVTRPTLDPEESFARAARAAADALRDAAARQYRCDPRSAARGAGDGAASPVLSFRHHRDPWAAATEPGRLDRPETPGTLHLDCTEGPERLFLTFAGTGARIAADDLAPLAEAYEQLLADALADPERAAGTLRLVAAAPAAPPAELPGEGETVLERFLRQARRTPDRAAVRSGDETLTYRELAHRAEAVGALLRTRGVRPGDRVPLLAPASADTLAAMIGTWLAGAAFAPVDPGWPTERVETVVGQLGSAPVLVPRAAAGVTLSVPSLPLPDPDGLPADLTSGPADAGGAAYVIFTSGTSGRPKGVVVGHRQLAHYAEAALHRFGLPDGAGFAAVSTLAADLSYTALFPTLAAGGCVHLFDTDVATSPRVLAERLRTDPVTAMKLVPSHLSVLLAEADDPRELLPKEVLVLGGEPLPRGLHDRLRELAPELRVFNHYGPTETTIGASCLPLEAPVDERCSSVPVGTGLGRNILTVADPEGRPLPPWCPGEVLISGPGVALGYLSELDEGREGFGWPVDGGTYRSGDVGRLVPGAGVEIVGRLDDQVKLRGYRLQLGEVEALLHRQPGVRAAAVVARTDENGLVSHLDAYVVATGDESAPSPGDLRTALGGELPAALVPTGWQVLERLPLTSNGKLDRKALTPVEAQRTRAGRPRDSVEQRLLVLWSEVLGVDGISPEDDFFELGGYSLRAIKLISRTNAAFGCRLPMSSIFSARTVAAMAGLVRGSAGQDSNLVPLRHAQGAAPVFCIHPGGGSTLSYWELARLLPADRPVHGVESWGLHGRPPQQDFHEMAADYADAIAAACAEPPVIIGWCYGGLMALQTARALRLKGREVARLVIVDCPAPGYDEEDEAGEEVQPLTEEVLVGRFAWHYELDLPAQLPSGPAAYALLLDAMRSNGHLPPTAGEDELRALFDVYASNMTALECLSEDTDPNTRTPDYPVLLVRAEPAGTPRDEDRTWGWRALVGPGLAFASVDADHHGIMRAPAVGDLADLVGRAIEEPTAQKRVTRD
ncbi:amino acid adenylation domain-containing protein [Kitasatospora sp. NPDC001175]|uniref:amino acid adenylation domain-containing protein n=1 Tax=Kitasatospora sp. NPDC001175 TaxID=3157103 RepID=UPI003D090012